MSKIIGKAKTALKGKKGISSVETAVIFFVIMIVFAVVLECMKIYLWQKK